MKKVILAALALVPALAFANPGAYVQAGAGMNFVDSDSSQISYLTGFGGNLGAGYLWGDNTSNYGLEVDGTTYPNSTTSHAGVNYKVNGYNISLLGVLKYTDCSSGFVAFAKLGAAYVTQKVTAKDGTGTSVIDDETISNNNGSFTNHRFAPEGVLGVGYQFNPNWEIDLSGNYVYTNNNDVGNNANLLVGVAYHFA